MTIIYIGATLTVNKITMCFSPSFFEDFLLGDTVQIFYQCKRFSLKILSFRYHHQKESQGERSEDLKTGCVITSGDQMEGYCHTK